MSLNSNMPPTNGNNNSNRGPGLLLTPLQQNLLYAALNSNKQPATQSPAVKALTMSPTSLETSPIVANNINEMQHTPNLPGYDYEFGDSSFDLSFADDGTAQMIGDLPGGHENSSSVLNSPDLDNADKRAHPDDEDDDDENPNGSKRRESTDKVAKKPGRKPLTSEPTSKRKAQNRAAQRAFRERKEKHLKDLETKVDELQKASEDANQENSALRAQVDKMTTELAQYKARLAVMNSQPVSGPSSSKFGSPAVNSLGDINFQFEFPRFGSLPGQATTAPSRPSPQQNWSSSSSPLATANGNKPMSPPQSNSSSKESSSSPANGMNSFKPRDDLSSFSAFFDPSFQRTSMSTSRASVDSGLHNFNNNHGTVTSSPSASSQSNAGPSSSCGTSPEPATQSPMGFKPLDTMTTIGEEQPALNGVHDNGIFAGIDPASFEWLAQQNGGGQFEPQLFGDYRDPQENVLTNNALDDSYFNDALDADFFMPYNMAPSPNLSKKNNICDQIDAVNNSDDFTVKSAPVGKNVDCNQVWSKLMETPQVKNGDFDLDSLCSELQKKAKCSGGGPVVSENDFQKVMSKWLGSKDSNASNGTPNLKA